MYSVRGPRDPKERPPGIDQACARCYLAGGAPPLELHPGAWICCPPPPLRPMRKSGRTAQVSAAQEGTHRFIPRVGISLAIYRSQKAFPWETPKKSLKRGDPGASRPRGHKRLEKESKMTIFQVFFGVFGSFSTRF